MSDQPTFDMGPTKTGVGVADEELPRSFGRYQVRRHLASGGMGAVYLAHDEVLQREVAVKCIKPVPGVLSKEFNARFMTEARCIAALKHSNVVSIYDLGIEGSVPYLVMEVLDGPPLSTLIDEGPIEVREARIVGIQIANALACAHDADIVHRDVKPANILRTGDGTWKLVDFGVAHAPDSSLTGAGDFLGTPAYAAIESLKESLFTNSSDIYGLGATLYHALTGAPPYGVGNSVKIALKAEEDPIGPISDKRPDLPADFAGLIDRSLSLHADERPSAVEFARLLAQASTEARQAQVPPAPTPPPDDEPDADSGGNMSMATTVMHRAETLPPAPAKGRGALLFGGLAALAIAGGAYAFVQSDSKPAETSPQLDAPDQPIVHAAIDAGAALPDADILPAGDVYVDDRLPELGEIESMRRSGKAAAAVKQLGALRTEHPNNAYLPFLLGQIHMERSFWKDGFQAYREAIEMSPLYRNDRRIARDAIRGLHSKSKPGQAITFIRDVLGSAAVDDLQNALETVKNPTVRGRIESLLEELR